MSFLNSTLIEGTIIDTPVSTAINNLLQCSFTIDSGPHASGIPITVSGKLAERLSGLLYKGRTVRIVGKIQCNSESPAISLSITAEHIEVRPIGIIKGVA